MGSELTTSILLAVTSGHVVSSADGALVTTLGFGVVKLVASLASAIFILDRFGRKRSAMIGCTFQALASFYIAGFLFKYPPVDVVDQATVTKAQKIAAEAATGFIFVSGIGWAMGINAIQYLMSGEMYSSIRVRSLGTMVSMATQ